jgi:hypothetical protein
MALAGQVILSEKGFSGAPSSRPMWLPSAKLIGPDRHAWTSRSGSLSRDAHQPDAHQWIESISDTLYNLAPPQALRREPRLSWSPVSDNVCSP